ncbi:unnamed protein product [Spodoptera exigua]|nr:unnamed protein product [Spodoptera exigua]
MVKPTLKTTPNKPLPFFTAGTLPERRQSRVTGRIVKVYSGTRPEPVLCAGEGFQADPRDCAVFYRCMKSGNGKFTVFRFQCGPGTVYDPETEVCNHPRSTRRTECGGLLPAAPVDRVNNNEIEREQNEIPSPITNIPIVASSPPTVKLTSTTSKLWTASSSTMSTATKRQASEIPSLFTNSYPWESTVGHTTTTSNSMILAQSTATQKTSYTEVPKWVSQSTTVTAPQYNSQDNICTSDGFMGDSENCRKFYRCVANQRGTYTRFEFSCSESTVWDDDTQSCNHAWAVKRSRCGRSNQNNHVATRTTEIAQTDKTTEKTIQQQLQTSYGSKVTQTQTQISNGSVIQNQTQINFGDRLNQNKAAKAEQNQAQISHGSAISQTQTQIDYSDKGVQTQLQIDHSQQSSPSQTQIHESTTNGPSTNTQSSPSNVGNTCERSGFMGDANDCKKFYRCIDNGRGGYTKFEFSCGEGTVWDQTIEACNHAWAVKECGGKGSSVTTGTTQVAISTSQSTQNYHTTASVPLQTTSEFVTQDYEDSGYGQQNQSPTSSSSTTLSSTTSTSALTTAKPPPNGNCQFSGFMGDPNDCKVFYRCVENGKGGFTKYEFKCGEGTVWDPDLDACNHAWAVKRCGGSSSSDINQTKTTTEKQNTQFTTSTLTTAVTQSTSEIPATQNDDYDTGYGQNNNDVMTSSTSKTTTTKQTQNTDHNTGNICQFSGFMGDHKDCKKFYRCVDNGNGGFTRYEFTCGEGTVWDPKIEACNHAWAVEKCGGSAQGHQETTTQAKPTTISEGTTMTGSEDSTISSTPLPSSTISTSTSMGSVPAISNDCKNSGFMGDQNDCKKFYRCVDNGKGSFTKYEFSCGEGTVWDQKIEACNHAWAVKECGSFVASSPSHQETSTQLHPTMSDEIGNGYPSNVDTDLDTSTQSTTTHSTTESSKEPSSNNNCVSSGFMGDKNNCKKFYRCVDNGNGAYTRYEFDCGEGTLWDQSIEACNHAWAVKDCGTLSNISSPAQQPVESSTTETGEISYPPSTDKTSTSTTHAHPDSSSSEICSKEGFVGDKNNCKIFYRCVDNGRGGYTKYEFTCGDGTYWNQEILSCDHATSDKMCVGQESSSSTQTHQPENDEIYTESSNMSSSTTTERNENQSQKPQVSSDVCESEGFYGNSNDCKMFYRCVDNGKGGYTKYDFTCGEGTIWDPEIQACNHESNNKNCSYSSAPTSSSSTANQPASVTESSMSSASQTQHTTESTQTSASSSSNYQCSSEGFFADPNNCKKFIRCVNNDKGGYTKYEFSCGDGTVWVQDILACDHDTGDTNCSSQTTSRPVTTEGNQQTTENNVVSSSPTETQTIDKQEDEYDSPNSEKPPPASSSGQCTSDGFYGNENDCRQFYRCVDNGQGGYTKYDFTCGEGTAWDSDVQTCNHIDQVKSCKPQPVHDESNSPNEASSTTSSSPTTAGSTSSSATTESSTSSSTTSSSDLEHTTASNKDTCNSEGYFGNSHDCKKFYRCVDNGKGSYTKYDFTCGEGTIWDQDITTCNHPQDVANPSCNQQQDGSSSSSTSSSSASSSSDTTSTTASSSSQSTTESSQSSSNCSQENSSKKPQKQNITCDRAGYYANPNDCKKFYRCVDWDGDGKRFSVYHFECGEGTIWDPAVETCNHEESVYPPRDCSGSESQSANPPPATEGTTTTQQETTSSQESTSTQSTSTSQSSTESSTTESSTTEQSTTSEQTTTQQSTSSEQTTSSQTSSQATTEQTTQQSSSTEQTTEQTTQSSSSSQTTTEQSTTSEQTTTQQSTTSESITTQSSSTTESHSTTEESTTEQSTTEQSTTEQSTTEQSTTEQATIEQSTTEQSTTEQSTTEQSTTEQSTSEQSTTEQQTTEQHTTEQSTTEPSTTEQSTTEQSTTEQSTTEQSTTEQSTTEQSTTEQSTTEQSTTEQSTTEQSTTEQSTTEQSTTEQSTTEQSTTEQSTTEQSTTEQSTTEQSTTEQSTTEQSNDNSTSDSKCPETNEDQSLFVCPTSFRRHPKYCNLFYQCDEDEDTHDVKIAVFTCPNNTIYDESQTRCLEESKADKKCDGEIAQKRRFKRLDKSYKEPIVVTKESQACPSAGYFSFEKDSECSPAFLKCKKDKRNVLRGLVYRCPRGYVFWSISKRCEPVDSVRDCKRSQNNWSGRWEIPVERKNVAPS